MKTTLLLALSTLWLSAKKPSLTLLLLLCVWPRASAAQAQFPGTVVVWGSNEIGQTHVPVAAQSGVTAIAAGGGHIVALKNDGLVVAWGAGTNNTGGMSLDFGQSQVPFAAQNAVTAIAAGFYHTVALKKDGKVVAWGLNNAGQVTGTTPIPEPYSGTTADPVTLGGQVLGGVTAIAAGWYHTLALKNDGSVVAWGDNSFGQTTVPMGLSGVIAVAAGGSHTVALKNDGSVVAWGLNDAGQVTVPVTAQSGVTAIATGRRHTVALKIDGKVVAWGDNSFGQTTVPVGLSGVSAVAAGGSHTVALKNDGSVVAWGNNDDGQTNVSAGLSGVTAIAAGGDVEAFGFHTVALLGTGLLMPASLNLWPCGNNLILSWPTNALGFKLQSTLRLTPPVIWIDSTNALVVNGAQFTVTNTTSGNARFYRLRKL